MSAPMVRALLAGTKTQTRRIIAGRILDKWTGRDEHRVDLFNMCPYGVPGDRLWVRETLTVDGDGVSYAADATPCHDPRADDLWDRYAHEDGPDLHPTSVPSIHMPRWASRLTLTLTEVIAEGIECEPADQTVICRRYDTGGWFQDWTSREANYVPTEQIAHASYRTLFENINGPGSWERNDWVWVLTFNLGSALPPSGATDSSARTGNPVGAGVQPLQGGQDG